MIDLNRQLEKWLDEGIISADQADLMRHSTLGSPQPETSEEASSGRIPIVTEILGYVGAALAVWAVIFLVSEYWGNLSDWAQAALFAVLALVLFSAGGFIVDNAEPALRRLSSVLWAGSVIALGGALYIVFDPISGLSVEATWLFVGLAAAVASGLMLWRQEMPAQHILLFVSVSMALTSGIMLIGEPEPFVIGFLAWGFGLVWILVTRAGVLRPFGTGVLIGAITMLYGAQITAIGDSEAAGIMLGLATAAMFATAGIMMKEKLAIVLGAIGIFWYVPQAMFYFFGETFGGMFGLFVVGLAIVALAIWFSRHREAL